APATISAYTRARELAEQVGEPGQLFPLLYGRVMMHLIRAELRATWEAAEQFWKVAERQSDPALVMVAHRLVGFYLLALGELAASRTHLEQALARYDPEQHRALAFHYAQDAGASSLAYLPWGQWLTGYPEQAVRTLDQAIALARAVHHTHTLAFVLFFATMLH